MQVVSTPRRARRREATRRRILDAAATVLGSRGRSAAAIESICRAAGCSKGAFYYHFGDRPALYRALIPHLTERGTARDGLASAGGALWQLALLGHRRPAVRGRLASTLRRLALRTGDGGLDSGGETHPEDGARLRRLLYLGRVSQSRLWARPGELPGSADVGPPTGAAAWEGTSVRGMRRTASGGG